MFKTLAIAAITAILMASPALSFSGNQGRTLVRSSNPLHAFMMDTTSDRFMKSVVRSFFDDVPYGLSTSIIPTGTAHYSYSDPRSLAIDVIENKDSYEVVADMPGVSKDSITIEVNPVDNTLTLSASRNRSLSIEQSKSVDNPSSEAQAQSTETSAKYTRNERLDFSVKRTFSLPKDADDGSIKATYVDGVLRVFISKRTGEFGPKRILVV